MRISLQPCVEHITDQQDARRDDAGEVAISVGFSTLRRMIIAGADSAITAIMKASTVPRAAPLPISASTTGMMPAALVCIGTPSSTAAGTDYHGASLLMIEAMKSCGT
jgi:hypothetical protein